MKLISHNFNPETGETILYLGNSTGIYKGISKFNPVDIGKPSEIFGGDLAELRAWLSFYKKELSKNKAKLKILDSLKRDILNFCTKEVSNSATRRILIFEKEQKKKIEENKTMIDFIKKEIKTYINHKDAHIKDKKD